jgi:hypothetical protein
MYINETGNVGIGTATPSNKLHVVGGNANTLRIDNAGEQYTSADWYNAGSSKASIYYDNTGAEFVTRTTSAAAIGFDTNLTRKMTILSGGNVGIGATSPAVKFVVSDAGAAGFEVNPTGGVGGGATVATYNRSTSAYTSLTTYASAMTWYSDGTTRAIDLLSTGNVGIGNSNPAHKLSVTGTMNVSGNANIGNVGTSSVTTPILTTGANTTPGTITGNWTLTAGSQLQATYADLAEYYEADDNYEPGTVLMFGGDKEVTLAEDGTSRVAGVVSTNPAYVMNSTCPGLLTAIALQGRVPCKVKGTISKGDMLVSAGDGYAVASENPSMGTVIGKALANFNGDEGVIEVAVGRL